MSESKPRGLAAELQRRNDLPSLRALERLNHAIREAREGIAVPVDVESVKRPLDRLVSQLKQP